ncbi:MAG TPA: hypothetical protein VGQ34_08870, partial [Sphingomicrobium sp.]|nr:hypothetical protein [Sphingomicrobium sp.]
MLFVGTDLSVKEDGTFYHVVGAKKDALQIEKDHRLAEVRLGQGANVKVSRGVKLSSLSATISNIQTESIDRASARAQLAAMQASMLLTDEAGDQEDRLHGHMTLLSAVAVRSGAGSGATFGADVTAGNLKAQQVAAAASYTDALPQLNQLTTSASTFLSQTLNRPDPIDDEVTIDASALPGLKLLGGPDLNGSAPGGSANGSLEQHNVPNGTAEVELTFDVSSPTPLDHAYIVVVANYGSLSKPDEV